MSTETILLEELDLSVLLDKGKKLVLHNDDVNTFDWVIECLIRYCKHSKEQAHQCALITHYKGKCEVKLGSEAQLRIQYETLLDKGLSVTLEENK